MDTQNISASVADALIEALPESDPAVQAARHHLPPPETPLHAVVAALAVLTRQGDLLALLQQFFATVRILWPEAQGWLVKVPQDSYPTEDNLIILGDAASLPRTLAVTGLQLRSPEAINVFSLGGRHFVLAHVARPHSPDEDLLVIETAAPLEPHGVSLLHDLLQVYKNHVLMLAMGDRDVLTGLTCHTQLQNRMTDQLSARLSGRRYRDAGNADYLALISLDEFHKLNEQFGHLAGEKALLETARALRETLHEDDPLFRLPGKEFAALLFDLSDEDARQLCEKLRGAAKAMQGNGDTVQTISLGVTPLHHDTLPQDLLEEARAALAEAKGQGRNRVCFHPDLVAEGRISPPDVPKSVELF